MLYIIISKCINDYGKLYFLHWLCHRWLCTCHTMSKPHYHFLSCYVQRFTKIIDFQNFSKLCVEFLLLSMRLQWHIGLHCRAQLLLKLCNIISISLCSSIHMCHLWLGTYHICGIKFRSLLVCSKSTTLYIAIFMKRSIERQTVLKI